MPESRFNALNRILAVRLDNIGDLVMLSPALRELKRAFPTAHLTLMASPAGSQVAPLLPWVDEVITWRAAWQDISPDSVLDVEKEQALFSLLRAGRFDAAFIFTSFSQSPHPPAYACYLAGVPLRVGQSREFGGALLSHWVKPSDERAYQVDRNLHLLRATGIPVADVSTELVTRPEDRSAVDQLLAGLGIGEGAPFLALAPGASAAARRYPEERFEQAARLLAGPAGLPLVLLGSQREIGRFPRLEALAAAHPLVHSLIGQTSVPEMAELIRRAAVVVCNNSGALHIAAALRRPVVVLFAGTEWEEQWVPPLDGIRLLNRPTACTPCFAFQCRYNLECLDLPPEEVAAAAAELLKIHPIEPAAQGKPGAALWERPNHDHTFNA